MLSIEQPKTVFFFFFFFKAEKTCLYANLDFIDLMSVYACESASVFMSYLACFCIPEAFFVLARLPAQDPLPTWILRRPVLRPHFLYSLFD